MVIDASIGVKWLVPEGDSIHAVKLVGRDDLIVPSLFFSEVGNALGKKARRGEINLDDVTDTFARLAQLVTLFDEVTVIDQAFRLASELRHSFYDCVYLAVAQTLGVSLVTADTKFAAKTVALGLDRRSVLLAADVQ